MTSLIRTLLLVFYICCCILIAPLSLWMLFNAQTWVGVGLAITGLATLLILPLAVRHYKRRENQKIWGLSAAGLALGVVFFLTAVVLSAPSGDPGPDSPIQHRFFREQGFGRFVLTNIIPESEQVNLGFLLMTFVDPYITIEQTRRVSPNTMNLYREMEQDDDFRELGSIMGLAYGQLLGLPFDAGHYYLYVPESARSEALSDAEPLPALMFLHGSAGSFKTYAFLTFSQPENIMEDVASWVNAGR